MVGYTRDTDTGQADGWLIKTDANGNMAWNKIYGGNFDDEGVAIQQTSDGGYIVTGYSCFIGDPYYTYGADLWLFKTDANGDMEWNKTYGGPGFDLCEDLESTSDGGYVLVGSTDSFGAGRSDFWLIKVDSSGNMEWNKTYGGTMYDGAYSVVKTSDGGYALAGTTQSFGAAYDDFWLVKTDVNGDMEWNKTYGGAYPDYGHTVEQTSDGKYIVAGATSSFGAGYLDAWLIKLAPPTYIHDIAVTNVVPSKTVVGQGFNLNINVTATNQGDYTETFDVTVYANTTIIETKEVTLTNGVSTTLTFFIWNTTGLAKGNYTISAYAWPVPGETDLDDNTLTDGIVTVTIPGDVDADFDVDLYDAVNLLVRYGAKAGQPQYDPNCDIDGDGDIDLYDAVILLAHYGQKYP